jgi:membrane protease YdiL (CAAX protease family)
MSTIPNVPEHSSPGTATSAASNNPLKASRRRWLGLGIVLLVSFGTFIASSAYYLSGQLGPSSGPTSEARLVAGLITETTSLLVLWYVLSGQGRGWRSIGWNFQWMDILRAVGLIFGSSLVTYAVWIAVQLSLAHSGHYLTPKSVRGLLGFGLSAFTIVLVCLNPFFEELIVRGYLMSEILDLSGNGTLAVVASVAVQMSYHLYQGLANGIVLTTTFVVFSIYFLRSRRIAPLVLAHFFLDAYALIRTVF